MDIKPLAALSSREVVEEEGIDCPCKDSRTTMIDAVKVSVTIKSLYLRSQPISIP